MDKLEQLREMLQQKASPEEIFTRKQEEVEQLKAELDLLRTHYTEMFILFLNAWLMSSDSLGQAVLRHLR